MRFQFFVEIRILYDGDAYNPDSIGHVLSEEGSHDLNLAPCQRPAIRSVHLALKRDPGRTTVDEELNQALRLHRNSSSVRLT